MSTFHELKPARKTLHNVFDRNINPCLTIKSGDMVRVNTPAFDAGVEKRQGLGVPHKKFTDFEPDRYDEQSVHTLIGPIAVEGALPGQTLEVKLHEIIPGNWGWVSAGGKSTYWNEKLQVSKEKQVMLDFEINYETMTAKSQFGNFNKKVKIRPFMGALGMPPNEPGQHTTVTPRYCGGNLDCKELVAGSTVYLPISVPDALFSIGDGHAVQGDGEVAGPAMECPMKQVDFSLTIRDDIKLTMPRAKTPTGWLTFGFHEDLNEAMWMALDQMLIFISETYQMSRTEAYAYASLVVDLRITQIVNKVKGVHAFLPHGSL